MIGSTPPASTTLPRHRDAIFSDLIVRGGEGHPFGVRLCNQQTVKRVAVMHWKGQQLWDFGGQHRPNGAIQNSGKRLCSARVILERRRASYKGVRYCLSERFGVPEDSPARRKI